MERRPLVLALILVFVLALGAGALVAAEASGGSDSPSLGSAGEPIPVLGPDTQGELPPSEVPAQTRDTGGVGAGGGSGGGSGADSGGASGGDTSGGGTSGGGTAGDGSGAGGDTATETAGIEAPPVGVDESAGSDVLPAPGDAAGSVEFGDVGLLPDLLPFGRPRAIDPCAGTEPGAGPERGCDGTGGVGGTVLEALDAIPLNIITVVVSREDECVDRYGNVADGEYPVVIASNTPGEFDVSRGEVGGPLGEPVHVSTSRRERRRVLEGTSELVFPPAHSCVLLTGLHPSDRIAVHVDGVNDAGFTDTWDGVLAIPTLRQRPPVEITPQSDRELLVTVPVKARQFADVLGAVQGETAGCAAIERDGEPRPLVLDATIPEAPEPIPDSVLRAPGYAYDPSYTRVSHLYVHLSERATAFDMCVFWLSSSRSFDPARVVEREAHAVSRPATYVVNIQVAGVEGHTTFDPNTLHVGVVNARSGGSYCQFTNDAAVAPGIGAAPLHDCGSLGTATLDAHVEVGHKVGDHWRTREAALDVRRSPCSTRTGRCERSATEWYRIAIPGRSRGLCGSGAGSCPTSDSPGTVVLRLAYTAPDGPFLHDWDLANTGSYAAPDTVEVAPPPYPQLDTLSATVAPFDPPITSVEKGVDINFPVVDRPLAGATAFIDTADGECIVDAARATATNTSDIRRLTLMGLCPGTTYNVVLQLTDTDGHTATYSTVPSRYPEPSFPWRAATVTTATYGLPIHFQMTATATQGGVKPLSTQRLGVEWINVFLDGEAVERDRDPDGTWCLPFDPFLGSFGDRDGPWPGIIHLRAQVRVNPGVCTAGFRYRDIVAVTFDEPVPLLLLLAGETVAFHRVVPFGTGGSLDLMLEFATSSP